MFQKQKIRMEKTERLILPNVYQQFCNQCGMERIFVSAEQATYLTKLTSREIFRLVETDAVHFFETEEGFLFICENSFRDSLQQNLFQVQEGKAIQSNYKV